MNVSQKEMRRVSVKKSLKILVLNYEFPPVGGGAGRVSAELSKEYIKKGCSVKVITSHYKGLPVYDIVDHVEIHRIPASRKQLDRSSLFQMGAFVFNTRKLIDSLCESWKPDIIHSHFLLPTSLLAYWIWKRFQIPYIITLHGGDVPSARQTRLHMLIRPLSHQVVREAKKLLVVSEDLKKLVWKDFHKLNHNISCITNGSSLQQRNGELRFEKPTFLFVGRLTNQKNLAFLIRSLKEVDKNYQLIVLGDGEERKNLESLIERLGLDEKVSLRGWVSDEQVLHYMKKSHCLVIPSRGEGMPIVGLQAYGVGLPVIGTNVMGTRELVEDGKSGYLVERDDETRLANLLSELCEDPDKLQEMSEYCLNLAREKYGWSNIADQYLAEIKEIL